MTGGNDYSNDVVDDDYMGYSDWENDEMRKNKKSSDKTESYSSKKCVLSEVITFLKALVNIFDIISENMSRIKK